MKITVRILLVCVLAFTLCVPTFAAEDRKKELQDAINRKVPGSTELAPDSNVNKFERSWRKCQRYYASATLEEKVNIDSYIFHNAIG